MSCPQPPATCHIINIVCTRVHLGNYSKLCDTVGGSIQLFIFQADNKHKEDKEHKKADLYATLNIIGNLLENVKRDLVYLRR